MSDLASKGRVWVEDYTRADGERVEGYWRDTPTVSQDWLRSLPDGTWYGWDKDVVYMPNKPLVEMINGRPQALWKAFYNPKEDRMFFWFTGENGGPHHEAMYKQAEDHDPNVAREISGDTVDISGFGTDWELEYWEYDPRYRSDSWAQTLAYRRSPTGDQDDVRAEMKKIEGAVQAQLRKRRKAMKDAVALGSAPEPVGALSVEEWDQKWLGVKRTYVEPYIRDGVHVDGYWRDGGTEEPSLVRPDIIKWAEKIRQEPGNGPRATRWLKPKGEWEKTTAAEIVGGYLYRFPTHKRGKWDESPFSIFITDIDKVKHDEDGNLVFPQYFDNPDIVVAPRDPAEAFVVEPGYRDAMQWQAERAGAANIADYENMLEEKLRRFTDPEDSYVAVRVGQNVVPEILKTGGLTTIHDEQAIEGAGIGGWGGKEEGADRAAMAKSRDWETRIWDIPKDAPARVRPIYGYVTNDREAVANVAVSAFGDVKLKLRDNVRPRTTFTYGDSHGIGGTIGTEDHPAIPSPIDNPSHLSVSPIYDLNGVDRVVDEGEKRVSPRLTPEERQKVMDIVKLQERQEWADRGEDWWDHTEDINFVVDMMNNDALWRSFMDIRYQREPTGGFAKTAQEQAQNIGSGIEDRAEREGWNPWRHGTYLETQTLGGISVNDIEAAFFPQEPSEDLKAALSQHGIEWGVYGPKLEEQDRKFKITPDGKRLTYVEGYTRDDGTHVDGYWRGRGNLFTSAAPAGKLGHLTEADWPDWLPHRIDSWLAGGHKDEAAAQADFDKVKEIADGWHGMTFGDFALAVRSVRGINPSNIEVEGEIWSLSGRKQIGSFDRKFIPQGGPIYKAGTVYHGSLSLMKEYQGAGFASAFYRESERLYREAGYNRVETFAVNAGSYAWARAGYRFKDALELYKTKSNGEGEMQGAVNDGHITQEELSEFWKRFPTRSEVNEAGSLDRLPEGRFRSEFEIASYGRDKSWVDWRGQRVWIGKLFMMVNSWDGEKDLVTQKSINLDKVGRVYDEWCEKKEREGGPTMAGIEDGHMWFEDDDELWDALTEAGQKRTFVKPHTRTDAHGNIEHVSGYWREDHHDGLGDRRRGPLDPATREDLRGVTGKWERWVKNLPADEKHAVIKYRMDARWVNEGLREHNGATYELSSRQQDWVRALDAAFGSAPVTDEDMVLYRGMRDVFLGDAKPGDTIQDKAYMSMGAQELADAFAGLGPDAHNLDYYLGDIKHPTVLEIDIPKGTPLGYANDPENDDPEFIAPRGSTVKVISVDYENGIHFIRAELENPLAKYMKMRKEINKKLPGGGIDEPVSDLEFEAEHPRGEGGRFREKPDFDVLDWAKNLGVNAHVVGGAVRDELLGRPVKDYDFMTPKVPVYELREKLAEHGNVEDLQVGGRTVGFRAWPRGGPKEGIEFAPPRKEVSTGPGRQDFDIVADPDAPIEEDAKRRDFTINALYKKLEGDSPEIIDPLGGVEDLNNRQLRTTSPDSFRDDPLRILRGLRFMSNLDFDLHPDTRKQMIEHADAVHEVSGERIGGGIEGSKGELTRMLGGPGVKRALREARDTGVLKQFLPEIEPLFGFNQESKYHDMTADEHTFRVVEAAQQMGASDEVLLAALLHDSGKPESAWMSPDGRLHYYGNPALGKESHEDIGVQKAVTALTRLKYPNDVRDKVIRLIQAHMFQTFRNPTPAKSRRFLAQHGEDAWDLLDLKRADIIGKSPGPDITPEQKADLDKVDRFEQMLKGAMNEPHRLSDLAINGGDLIAAGYKPGPKMGALLAYLLNEVIGSPKLNKREWLLSAAERWWRTHE